MSRMLQRFVRCQEKRAFRKRAEAQREAARLITNYAQHQR